MAADDPRRLPATPEELESLRKAAKTAYKGRSFAEAVEMYRRIVDSPALLAEGPSAALIDRSSFAAALTSANRLDEAAVEFERVISAGPEDPKPRYKLAQVLSRMGRHEDAVDHLRQAVAMDGSEANYHWRLAVELRALGRDAEARQALNRALDINPDHTEAQLLLLDQAMISSAERDGMVDEVDDRARAVEIGAASRAGSGLSLPRPAKPGRRLRHHPAMILVEAVLMLFVAIWLRSTFT